MSVMDWWNKNIGETPASPASDTMGGRVELGEKCGFGHLMPVIGVEVSNALLPRVESIQFVLGHLQNTT